MAEAEEKPAAAPKKKKRGKKPETQIAETSGGTTQDAWTDQGRLMALECRRRPRGRDSGTLVR